MSELEIRERHSLALRICHWLNVPILYLMIWSGILIYWAHQAYIKIPDNIGPFSLHHRLAEGMGWHFFMMWFFVLNGFFYLVILTVTRRWKELLPKLSDFPAAIRYTLYDLKISNTAPEWSGRYNPAQKIAYFSVIVLGFGSLLSGLAIYKPVQLGWLAGIFGGYAAARFFHFLFMTGFVFFVIIHIIQVIRTGWNNFRSMVAGYEIKE